MPPVAQIVIWGQISFFQYITSLLLNFTKICIHKFIPMIQLNIVILSAYTSICDTRHQMHNISVGDPINISCISYTISYKIKYSNGSKKPMRVMGSRSVIVLWSYTSKQEAYLPLKNVGLVSHHTPDINFITFYTIQHIEGGTLKHLTIFCSRCPIGHRSVLVQANKCWLSSMTAHGAGILPVTGPANEWWSYMATPSLTDQSHIQKWSLMVLPGLNELRNDSVIYQLFKKSFEPSLRNICINSIFNNYIPDDCTYVFYTRFALISFHGRNMKVIGNYRIVFMDITISIEKIVKIYRTPSHNCNDTWDFL